MRVIACFLACALSASAFAQEPAPAPAEPAPDAAAEADAEAAALYRLGLDLAAKGQYADACGIFDRITKEHAGSEYAVKAEEQMALAALAEGGAACGGAPPEPSEGEGTSDEELTDKERRLKASAGKRPDGKVELIVSQAFAGPAFFGLGLPASAGVNVPWVYLTGGLVGLGVGIGVPLAISSKYDVSEGQAMTVATGELIGTWNGFFIAGAIPAVWYSNDPFQAVSAVVTSGFAIGLGAGIGSAVAFKPTGGQASMLRSGFTWGAYFGGASLLFWASGPGVTTTQVFLQIGIPSDVGAIIGAIASTQWPISRAHMNIVNLSGYAGALGLGLLYGIISLASPDTSYGPVWGSVLSTGAIAGIVTGAVLSKNMDAPKLAWMGNGMPLHVDGRHVTLGLPMPSPRLAPDGTIGVDVQIAAGRW